MYYFYINDSPIHKSYTWTACSRHMHTLHCMFICRRLTRAEQCEPPHTLTGSGSGMETCKWRSDGWLKVKGHGLSGKCHPLRTRVIWSLAPALFHCLSEACEKVKVGQASSLQIALSEDWSDVTNKSCFLFRFFGYPFI